MVSFEELPDIRPLPKHHGTQQDLSTNAGESGPRITEDRRGN